MIFRTATVALLAAGLCSAALAQESDGKQPALGNVADTSARATALGGLSQDRIVSDLRNGLAAPATWTDTLEKIDDTTVIHVVTVGDLQGGSARIDAALDAALAEQTGLVAGRAEVGLNIHVDAALAEANFVSDQVVALYPAEDGSVIVVIDDRV